MTDTGRFQYEATTPETLRLAARLREHPFDHARLAQALYEDNRAAYLDGRVDRVARAALGARTPTWCGPTCCRRTSSARASARATSTT